MPNPGMPCDGATLQCADYVHSLQGGTCYALAAGEVGPVCNSGGECVAATPQDCEPVQGDVIASCDEACLRAAVLCSAFSPAGGVRDDAFCEGDGTTDACATFCVNRSDLKVVVNVCSAGQCVQIEEIPCDAFCENGMCNTSCTEQWHCSMFNVCNTMTGICEPP